MTPLVQRIVARYERHFLRSDLVLATLAGIVAVIGLRLTYGDFAGIAMGTRQQLYVTGAGISAALTGFGLVAITVLLDLTASPPVSLLKKSPHFPLLYETFLSTTRYMSLTTVVLIAAIVVDHDAIAPFWLVLAVVSSTLVSAVRFSRCLWILAKVLRIVTKAAANLI